MSTPRTTGRTRGRRTNKYAQLPLYQKREVSNKRALEELEKEGLLEDFLKYQKEGSLWDAIKNFGSGALDVLQRGEYATAGAFEETYGGEPGITGEEAGRAVSRVGSELFSGIGDIQGQKKTWGEVVREKFPGYKEFAEEHPIASIGTDLAMSVGLDPTTYIPAAIIAKGTGKIGKGAGYLRKQLLKTKTYQGIEADIGKAFVPGYGWIKAGAAKGHDIMWSESTFMKSRQARLLKQIEPDLKVIAKWTPEKTKNFIRVMYGDAGIAPLSDDVSTIATSLKQSLRGVGEEESAVFGKGTKWLRENYLPNNAKQLTEFAENIGDYLGSGMGRGMRKVAAPFQKGKKIITGEDFLTWLDNIGVPEDKLTDVVLMNLTGRMRQSATKIFQVRVTERLIKELPDVFEEVPFGTKNVWALTKEGKAIVRPGNTLWMPGGNLRFFKQNLIDSMTPKTRSILENGGIITNDIQKEISKLIGKSGTDILESRGALKELEEHILRISDSGADFLERVKSSIGNLNNEASLTRYIKALYTYSEKAGDPVSKEIGSKISKFMLNASLNKTFIGVTSKVKAYQVPTDIVKEIDKVSFRLANENGIWKYWDKTLNYFKNTAILSPFFHMRNIVSSSAQNYVADMNPARYYDAIKALIPTTDDKAMILGKTAKYWRETFQKWGITRGSFVGQMTEDVGLPGVKQVFHANRWIGSHIEELQRGSLFMDDFLKNGNDELKAALQVKKFHFDYDELTDFEREYMKRIIPFYSWSKHNIPLTLEMLFKAPKKYRNIAKLKEAISGGEESQYNPDWWKQQDVWETKGNFAVHVGLPYSDLNQFLKNPAQYTGPAGAVMAEAINYDPFYQKKIQEFKGQTVPLVTVGQRTIDINPRIKYAIDSFLPVFKRYGTDLSKDITAYMNEKDVAKRKARYKIIQKVIGVRILPKVKEDRDKQRVYGLQKQLRDFERYREQEGF